MGKSKKEKKFRKHNLNSVATYYSCNLILSDLPNNLIIKLTRFSPFHVTEDFDTAGTMNHPLILLLLHRMTPSTRIVFSKVQAKRIIIHKHITRD